MRRVHWPAPDPCSQHQHRYLLLVGDRDPHEGMRDPRPANEVGTGDFGPFGRFKNASHCKSGRRLIGDQDWPSASTLKGGIHRPVLNAGSANEEDHPRIEKNWVEGCLGQPSASG